MTTGQARYEGSGLFIPARRPEEKGALRAFRPTRAVPAAIAALVLLVLGVLTAVHVISALLGRPVRLVPYDRLAQWARTTTWHDSRALAVASALALLGLLLLLIAVVPGRGRLVPLRTGDPDLLVGVPRRTLAGVLAAAAADVDGVRRARAKVYGWRVDVLAKTDLRETSELTERVRAAVEDKLGELSPAHRMAVRVRVRGRS